MGIIESSLFYIISFYIVSKCLAYGWQYQKFNIINTFGIVILMIITAGRYMTGADYLTTTGGFISISRLPWQSFFSTVKRNWIYAFIVRFFYPHIGRAGVFCIFGLLTVLPVYHVLKKQSDKLPGTLCIFLFLVSYYVMQFNILKQVIAISFVFLSVYYAINNRFFRFFSAMLVAFGFHSSALIAILAWPLIRHNESLSVSRLKRTVILLAVIVGTVFYQSLIQRLGNSSDMFSNYSTYDQLVAGMGNRDLIIKALKLFFVIVFYKKYDIPEREKRFCLYLAIIIFTVGFTGFFNPFIKRITLYFELPLDIYLFGYLYTLMPYNNYKIIRPFAYIYIIAVFIVTCVVNGSVVPYTFNPFGV